MDQVGDAEGGERPEHDPERQQGRMLVPQVRDGRCALARADAEHEQHEEREGELHDEYRDEVPEEAPEGIDREPEIDEVPVAEQHAARNGPEDEGAGDESDRVEQGGEAARGIEAKPQSADRQGQEPEEQAGGEGSRAQDVRIAPQRGEVGPEGGGEGDPEGKLPGVRGRQGASPRARSVTLPATNRRAKPRKMPALER